MHKVLDVKDLQPGMLVTSVVSQHGPVKIRKIGMIRSPEMIKGLAEMGVTEVEVDLSQSLGVYGHDQADEPLQEKVDLQITEEQATAKLTPTQQLLQNERRSEKANNDVAQHYHRSLFMPSMDSLPSVWDLYGKNTALLLLLIIGGVCVGWNIASIPQWLLLSKSKDYVVIDYQARNTAALPQARVAEKIADESAEAIVEIEPEPLVLGYQPEGDSNRQTLDRIAENQGQTILNEPEQAQSEPNVSAALLDKINKAIADLDNNPDAAASNLQATNYDDLPRIDQLSIAIQTQIPAMSFSAHMYSSSRDGRWVRVNGRRLIEGDFIAEGLQLVNIEPQKVILSFKNEVFTMNALSDW